MRVDSLVKINTSTFFLDIETELMNFRNLVNIRGVKAMIYFYDQRFLHVYINIRNTQFMRDG